MIGYFVFVFVLFACLFDCLLLLPVLILLFLNYITQASCTSTTQDIIM